MRKSNLIITKGSVVFAKFEANTKDAYLNDRPLVVVSNPTNILNSITVCTCGTREKPGILASFWNYERNTYIGGNEVSNIYPYMLLTIRLEAIKCCIGQLDPYVMNAIDKAIDYHLGRTNELPPYLNPVQEEIQYIGYNTINGHSFTRNEIISEELRESYAGKWVKGTVQAPQIKVKDTIKKNKKRKSKCATEKKNEKNVEEVNMHSAECGLRNYNEFTRDESGDNISQEAYDKIISTNKPAIDFWLKKEVLFPLDPALINNPNAILKLIGPVATTCILSRSIPISKICKKYSLSVKDATLMRVNLTNYFMVEEVARRHANKVKENKNPVDERSTPRIMGVILAKEFIFNERLTKKEQAFQEAYSLDTSDGRKWRSVREYYKVNRKLFVK